MDRAQLFRDFASDLNRQDKAELIPSWLASAEFRLNNLLRTREMVTRAILPITERVFPGPPDFLEAETISVQRATENPVEPGPQVSTLFYLPAEEIDNGPAPFRRQFPQYYTIRGSYFELVGWNSENTGYQIQLYYYRELPRLTQDTSTNWLLDKAPHLYRNAMMAFALQHLEEDARAQAFLQEVAAECSAMNERSSAMKYGSGPLLKRLAPKMGGRRS